MKTKRKKTKILDFTKANDAFVFDLFRSLQEMKKKFPNLKIKTSQAK